MKILVFLAGLALASSALADIHDPPSNEYGPTRKLGRGFSNFFLAPAEIPVAIATVNTNESNSAVGGYRVVRGLGRSATRDIAGLLETLPGPVPGYRESY